MNKKSRKKLKLHFETVRNLDMERASGGLTGWFCPTTDPCAVSQAFTNCNYCPNWSAVGSTCIGCIDNRD